MRHARDDSGVAGNPFKIQGTERDDIV